MYRRPTSKPATKAEKDLDLKFSRISKILRNPKAEAKTKMESLRVRTSALLFHRVTSTNHLCVVREAYTAHPLRIMPPPEIIIFVSSLVLFLVLF